LRSFKDKTYAETFPAVSTKIREESSAKHTGNQFTKTNQKIKGFIFVFGKETQARHFSQKKV
jgi:hypothetical protein